MSRYAVLIALRTAELTSPVPMPNARPAIHSWPLMFCSVYKFPFTLFANSTIFCSASASSLPTVHLPVQPMLHVCPQAPLQRGEESKAVPWALNAMAACIDAEIPLQRLLGIAWRIAAFCSIVTPVSRLNEKYMVCCPHASRHLQHKEWPNRSWH